MSNDNKARGMQQPLPILVALLFSFILSPVSHAMLMSHGDGSLTVDTATGMHWLDIDHSTNLSYKEMRIEMLSGGLFDGFRYATREEVQALFLNSGIVDINASSAGNVQPALDLMALLGFTSSSRGINEIFGLTGTTHSGGVGSGMLDHFYSGGEAFYDASVAGPTYGMDYKSNSIGSWLVTTAEVPLPPALLLFSSALALSGLIKRHSRRLRKSMLK